MMLAGIPGADPDPVSFWPTSRAPHPHVGAWGVFHVATAEPHIPDVRIPAGITSNGEA